MSIGAVTQARGLQVIEQLDDLQAEIERLEASVGGFDERLCKVLRQELDGTIESVKNPELLLVPIAETIRSYVKRINAVNGAIDNIKSRLEV